MQYIVEVSRGDATIDDGERPESLSCITSVLVVHASLLLISHAISSIYQLVHRAPERTMLPAAQCIHYRPFRSTCLSQRLLLSGTH